MISAATPVHDAEAGTNHPFKTGRVLHTRPIPPHCILMGYSLFKSPWPKKSEHLTIQRKWRDLDRTLASFENSSPITTDSSKKKKGGVGDCKNN
jgi:hypothetical protein